MAEIVQFPGVANGINKNDLFKYLVNLHVHLKSTPEADLALYLGQLTEVIEYFKVETPTRPKAKVVEPDAERREEKLSSNIYKLVSRNLMIIFTSLTNKVHDFTNNLLNHLQVSESGELPPISKISIKILIDLFDTFPNSLGSIVNFSANQIYKILKKSPTIDSSLVYLLNSITKNATKLDIDEKFQAKLMKIITKNIVQPQISFELYLDSKSSEETATTILLKKSYILVYKNLLLLAVSTNYENLLALSTSSSSAGSKMKPETIMVQQNQFQVSLLASNEKTFHFCLSNPNKEIRVAAIELLSHLLINLVPTGKFSPIEYLINQYNLPSANCWDSSLTTIIDFDNDSLSIDIRKEKNTLLGHDSISQINQATELLLSQTSIVETFILYLQLEQFQNSEYLSTNLTFILDSVLSKFGELNQAKNHIQNQHWDKVLIHWSSAIDFIIKEIGSTCYEVLTSYVYTKFNLDYSSEKSSMDTEFTASRPTTSLRKRESMLFGFRGKSSSKSKAKDAKLKEIRPYHNSSQSFLLLYIFEVLIPFGINFNSVIQSKSKDSQEKTIQDRAIEEEESEDSKTQENSFIRDILFKLIVNENDYTRNYALKALLLYAKVNEVEINLIVLHAFKMVNLEYKASDSKDGKSNTSTSEENICNSTPTKLISYSLVLLSLIKQTDSILLQNSTIVKILSFCTQNLKHNNNSNYTNSLKNSACWVILSSLVTYYNDSEFVKLNSSQFLVFWKSLLTSQFISTSLTADSQESQSNEIIDNLKLRNFSLVCLLNYVESVDLSPESLKQIQFLLTKSYNYLTYLESNIPNVGSYTNLNNQLFNEVDYNPNLLNNIHFMNSTSFKLSLDRIMISLILYSKKIILQSFTKLAALLKNDINSNMMIFLIKTFSDSKIFSRILGNESSEKSKSKASTSAASHLVDYDHDTILVGEDYNYSFGITSKYQGVSANIDELLIKNGPKDHDSSIVFSSPNYQDLVTQELKFKDTFASKEGNSSNIRPIESHLEDDFHTWIDLFEKLVFKSVGHSINYDPNIYLTQRYSVHEEFSPPIFTSLVDLSIELFQLVFPNLSLQIQSSLLEQMRNSLTTKAVDPLRLKAVKVNVSIALHGLVNNAIKRKLTLDAQVVKIIGDILSKIETNNQHLITINSDTIGLAGLLVSKSTVNELISKYVNEIVNDSNPYKRGFSIITLARLYEKTKFGYHDTYNVILQLLNDPNPIVYYYSLEAIIILFETNVDSVNYIPEILTKVYENYLSENFGYDISNKTLINLKTKYNSIGLITRLLKVLVTSLGPRLTELAEDQKLKIKNLIIALSHGIGLATINDYTDVYKYLLALFQELIIFDPKLIEDEVSFFTELLNLIISKNLKVGLVSPSPTSIAKDSIFPFTTSTDLYEASYACYVELIKIYGVKIVDKETISLLWISMNLKPCKELKQFITLWLESSLEMNWFSILSSLFKLSSKKLLGPFIEGNYQQKLLPLQQRQKKKQLNKLEFKDEEIENIVGGDDESMDKNEPITWEFKLYIYDLLNHLLDLASSNGRLLESLKDKIQEIVKISFLGSTSPISSIKLGGIHLLDKVLRLFGHMADPLYPGVSILEQQQAQIISALIPCFNSDNDSKVIVNTINVSSKFINLPRIKFYSKQRILKTLIYLLEEISANKFLKFGFLENMSEYGRKSIQLSILNCWALLKIDAEEDQETTEPELIETLEKYSTLLTSLWILVLRDYSTLKFNDTSNRELITYGNYWINFISVLSIQLERNPQFIDEYLGGDGENFFFVLFSQCVESLIKNKSVPEILNSLKRLVKISALVSLLFHDDIFGEIIDLFDRLILIDDNTEVQCELVEIVSTISNTYVTNATGEVSLEKVENGFDKLFELIRVEMLPLFNILPFLRTDFDPSSETQKLTLRSCDSAPSLLILKKTLEKLVEMMAMFPVVVKVDLYSCLLFMFSKIYEFKNELLISVILPHLKQVLSESSQFENNLVQNFNDIIRSHYSISKELKYSVITSMVLITSGNIQLSQKDSEDLGKALIGLLGDKESANMAIQCIKSLNQYSSKIQKPLLVMKYLVSDLMTMLSSEESLEIDPKISFEILISFSRVLTDDAKLVALYSVLIPLLIRYNDASKLSKNYLHEKLLYLVQYSPLSFKIVVNGKLSDGQRVLTEELVKMQETKEEVNKEEIELKRFNES
ncbi:uncharacterized protein CANTADRAFT_27360 [Suhomyces tanzawaensis NRRL Y-17324]|uniref:LAA1-like C-terminal TPR repeats domain-containing protein n=1 Tax=Suhomyces tanzawaensis NRRL Y-17324 TaxID=984487 RepID=A0A1E4SDQ8_9ASCO|nr:uncharacterized protein CANTADRAFT_27360 [Suhomyces tanzawaensis NRRL Y-17324]ODV77647.1 hypothetical protein CANTADRAFT_27360 [Suhomyces tanzawaensis NRRL Y-17324]